MSSLMENLAKRYLSKRGYVCRKAPKQPKVGDTIVFLTGGDWAHNDSYITEAVVKKMSDTLKMDNKPFVKYGYFYVEARDKNGALKHMGVVHPKEVLENRGNQNGDS